MQGNEPKDLVLVLDVTSFTKEGFIASSSIAGKQASIEFDEADAGVFLSVEICRRLQVRVGSVVTMIVEGEGRPTVAESVVAGAGGGLRISNAKVYYELGRNGGGVLRLRKGPARAGSS